MSERRVTHIVGQSRRLHYRSYLLEERAAELRMAFHQQTGHIIAERFAQRRHLKGMGQAVMYEDRARQREHLRLVLQTPEGRGIDQTVAVAFELRAVVVTLRMPVLLTKAFVRYEFSNP